MLIDEIELYKSKIQSKIFSLSQEMGSVAVIGGDIDNKCLLELFNILSILSFAETTDASKEEILSYVIWKYELSDVDVLPFIFPNVEYVSDGFNSALYYTKTEIDTLLSDVDPVFPVGTPNVNVAVGGWFSGYILAGKRVINALIDLGVQYINPVTNLSLTSASSVERGSVITSISVNRTRSLGSATFESATYSQPNSTDVSDIAGGPIARTISGLNITANNTTNISGGIPVHVLTLTTTYRRLPGDLSIDPLLTELDSVSVGFVSPVYFGVLSLANTSSASAIQALSKASLLNSRARSGLSFSPTSLAGRIVYAYPARLFDLSNILFEGFSANQLSNFNNPITVMMSFGSNAPDELYNVYVYSTDVSPTTIVASFS